MKKKTKTAIAIAVSVITTTALSTVVGSLLTSFCLKKSGF